MLHLLMSWHGYLFQMISRHTVFFLYLSSHWMFGCTKSAERLLHIVPLKECSAHEDTPAVFVPLHHLPMTLCSGWCVLWLLRAAVGEHKVNMFCWDDHSTTSSRRRSAIWMWRVLKYWYSKIVKKGDASRKMDCSVPLHFWNCELI